MGWKLTAGTEAGPLFEVENLEHLVLLVHRGEGWGGNRGNGQSERACCAGRGLHPQVKGSHGKALHVGLWGQISGHCYDKT